jgi:hypothetical protein
VKQARRARAFIAWLSACALAGAAHVFGSSTALLSDTMGLSILLSGPALLLLAPRARAQEWRRPSFDIALFAACALFLLIADAADFFRASALQSAITGGSRAAFMGFNAVLALAAGALGGYAYWLFSGAPRPPY